MVREVLMGVVGCTGVGKTCLVLQWLQGRYVEDPSPTVECVYRLAYALDGDAPVPLTVVDTSGQDALRVVRDGVLAGCNAFLLVYDVSDRASFDAIGHFHARIAVLTQKSQCRSSIRCVLAANKTDGDPATRVVSSAEGQHMAETLDCPFVEVTAKDTASAASAFETLMRQAALDAETNCNTSSDDLSDGSSETSLPPNRHRSTSEQKRHKKRTKCVML